jgi:uncharacterized protein (DUF983 family)
MAIKKDENKLAAGITILIIGLIHLIEKSRMITFNAAVWQELIDWRSYFIYAALAFLIVKTQKTFGIVLLVLGILLRINTLLHFLGKFQDYLIPSFLIIIGATLIIGVLRK